MRPVKTLIRLQADLNLPWTHISKDTLSGVAAHVFLYFQLCFYSILNHFGRMLFDEKHYLKVVKVCVTKISVKRITSMKYDKYLQVSLKLGQNNLHLFRAYLSFFSSF